MSTDRSDIPNLPLLSHTSLPKTERRGDSTETIVFIHGAFSSRHDWDPVVQRLEQEDFHLLIPDLPAHGDSRDLGAFTVDHSADSIARLIREKAIRGRAHVVGLSLGAIVAINLASRYPEVVQTALVSGYEKYPRTAMSAWMPQGLWFSTRMESWIPRPLVRWLMDGADIARADSGVVTVGLCRAVADALTNPSWPDPWPARTLIVAAGKRGVLPTADHPENAKKLMGVGQGLNERTIAVVYPVMRHCLELGFGRTNSPTTLLGFERC